MADPENLYSALDIPQDADEAAIKAAHRKAVKRHHPDKGGDRERFEVVQRAFLVLSDAAKRAKYDQTGQVDDGPDNAIGELSTVIIQAFDAAMNEAGEQYDRMDMIAKTKTHILGRMRKAEFAVAAGAGPLSTAENLLKRLSFKGGGTDPIGNSIRKRIADINQAIAATKHEAAVCQAAAAYLDHYGFEFEPMQTPETEATWRVFRPTGSRPRGFYDDI